MISDLGYIQTHHFLFFSFFCCNRNDLPNPNNEHRFNEITDNEREKEMKFREYEIQDQIKKGLKERSRERGRT